MNDTLNPIVELCPPHVYGIVVKYAAWSSDNTEFTPPEGQGVVSVEQCLYCGALKEQPDA